MEDDFEDILIGCEGEKAGQSLFTFDPVSAFCGRSRLTAMTSTAGMSVWLEDDLMASAYKDIASLVQNQAELVVQGKPTSGRRRIDIIVTGQQLVPVPAVLQVSGWISGTESGSGGFGRC